MAYTMGKLKKQGRRNDINYYKEFLCQVCHTIFQINVWQIACMGRGKEGQFLHDDIYGPYSTNLQAYNC